MKTHCTGLVQAGQQFLQVCDSLLRLLPQQLGAGGPDILPGPGAGNAQRLLGLNLGARLLELQLARRDDVRQPFLCVEKRVASFGNPYG